MDSLFTAALREGIELVDEWSAIGALAAEHQELIRSELLERILAEFDTFTYSQFYSDEADVSELRWPEGIADDLNFELDETEFADAKKRARKRQRLQKAATGEVGTRSKAASSVAPEESEANLEAELDLLFARR